MTDDDEFSFSRSYRASCSRAEERIAVCAVESSLFFRESNACSLTCSSSEGDESSCFRFPLFIFWCGGCRGEECVDGLSSGVFLFLFGECSFVHEVTQVEEREDYKNLCHLYKVVIYCKGF